MNKIAFLTALMAHSLAWGADLSAGDLLDKLKAEGLSARAYGLMLGQMNSVKYSRRYVGILDYTLPSNVPRFFLIDTKNGTFKKFPASHGVNSGGAETVCVSNKIGSNQSSLGFAQVKATVKSGAWGPYCTLHPVRPYNCSPPCGPMSNSNIEQRQILAHSAGYSSPAFLKKYGFWGRSLGCLALPPENINEVLSALGPGSLILSYHDRLWDDAQKQPGVEHCVGGKRPSIPAATDWEIKENKIGVNAFRSMKARYLPGAAAQPAAEPVVR